MNKIEAFFNLKRNRILLLIFLTAMILRIGCNIIRQELFFDKPFLIFHSGQGDDRSSSDSIWYTEAAKGFLKGRGVVTMGLNIIPPDNPKSFPYYADLKIIDNDYYLHKNIPPLYPLFLALCYFLGGVNTLAYFIPQLILSSLTCLLVYLIAEEIFNKPVALLAGLVVACYPDLIFWTSFIRTETLFIFLLTLSFWLLMRGNSKDNPFLIYIGAVTIGLAGLTRITIIPFLPFIFLWQSYYSSDNRKKNFKIALVMVLIIFIVLLPWALRNFILFGKFTVLTEEAGILIGTANLQYDHSKINYGYDSHDHLILKTLVFVKDNFKEYLSSCLRRFLIFWSPFTAVMQPLAKLYKGLAWIIIFPAAFWGMLASRKSRGKGGLLLVIFIFYYALLHAASYADLGLIYRYPISPFLCIFASYTFYNFYKKQMMLKNNNHK
ncbi:MAG: glycosyltransferase family 39 protein [Candidatus Omnitrophica bacterium]|jgi:4-amino-4-deoxy-L-arabinose transferase-like glycosyltransferase|nr:glycosyltransferase family 39 protein [Candidatus Omnitrophota bacterium]